MRRLIDKPSHDLQHVIFSGNTDIFQMVVYSSLQSWIKRIAQLALILTRDISCFLGTYFLPRGSIEASTLGVRGEGKILTVIRLINVHNKNVVPPQGTYVRAQLDTYIQRSGCL